MKDSSALIEKTNQSGKHDIAHFDVIVKLYIDTKAGLTEAYEDELLGGVVTVNAKGKRISNTGWNEDELYKEQEIQLEDVTLKAVPYCNWGNRKTGEMAVWIKELL